MANKPRGVVYFCCLVGIPSGFICFCRSSCWRTVGGFFYRENFSMRLYSFYFELLATLFEFLEKLLPYRNDCIVLISINELPLSTFG